ncbi:hypothetical protein KKC91_10895 [bacterium]|nr:hypothetical protein [bacterium]
MPPLKKGYHKVDKSSRTKVRRNGNGKIHPYPLGGGDKADPIREFSDGVRKILIVNCNLFKEIRTESGLFRRWFNRLVTRERKPRKKQIDEETIAIQTNETAYYEQYAPVTVWPARDSLSQKWRRVKEWDDYINDPMDKMVIKKGT